MSTVEEQIAALNEIADRAEQELTQQPRRVTLEDFLDEKQIRECLKLGGLVLVRGEPVKRFTALDDTALTKAIREKVIEPNMAEINQKLGQENDASYLAYAVTYIIQQLQRQAR